jgi:hypothetical protein
LIPKVVVRVGETSDVLIKLGKPTVLVHVEVVDADTSEPVLQARLNVSKPSYNDVLLSKSTDRSGEIRLLMPHGPIKFQISAPGYLEWHLPPTEHSTPDILVRTPLVLKVRLKKAPNSQATEKKTTG